MTRHDYGFLKEPKVQGTVLVFIRWLLKLVKDRQQVSPNIVTLGFEILLDLCESQSGNQIDSFLPQLSSIITKILSNDYKHLKHTAHLVAIKVWKVCLTKYFDAFLADFTPYAQARGKLRLELKPKEASGISQLTPGSKQVVLLPLASCFKHIYDSLYYCKHV